MSSALDTQAAACRAGSEVVGPIPRPGEFAPWARPWRATLGLVAIVTLLRIVYLVWFCPYTLVEDEAHYWEWSRRLDLSYYSKGPGIAWTIAASVRTFGDIEWAVRLPAALASGVACLAVAGLARDASRDGRVGFLAACCFLLAPMFQILGLVMTIDGPYAACWALACWAAWRALARGDAWAWPALGLAVGAGVLYKYTMLLALPGFLAFGLLWRRDLRLGPRHGLAMVASLACFALAVTPIIVWNQREGWPTARHLLGHLGVRGGDMPVVQGAGGWTYRPKWTLSFLGSQIGLMGPIIVLVAIEAGRAWLCRAGDRETWRAKSFLLLCGAPMIAFYLLVSLVAEPEGNWTLAGWITPMGLAGWRVVEGMTTWRQRVAAWRALPVPRPWRGVYRRRPETWSQASWFIAVFIGVAMGLGLLRLDLLARLPVVGRLVPLGRFTDADVMVASAARLADELRAETGLEPFHILTFYGRASQFAFYLPGHPVVYCSTSLMGSRRTQYDYWADTDLRRNESLLRGRPAVAVGGRDAPWDVPFERVEPVGTLPGDRKRDRPAVKAYGYRGFPGLSGE